MSPLVITLLLTVGGVLSVSLEELRGPRFVRDPPAVLELSNSTGASLDCWVSSSTPVTIRWIDAHSNDVVHIPGVRHILSNGSLILPPFRSDFYRPDVHQGVYRCVATNTFGSIVSPSIVVKTAVVSAYKVYVADAHTLLGNSALLSCLLPAELNWALQITHWMAGSHLIDAQDIPQPDSKYAVISGNLHVTNVQLEDSRLTYRCFTKNRLDGQQASSPAGRIVLKTRDAMATGSDPSVAAPQLNQPPLTIIHNQLGHDILLPCNVQGLPVPKIRWMKVSSSGSATALISDHRRIVSSAASSSGWLLLRQSTGQDSGRYRCQATNVHGQVEADVQLNVHGPYQVNVEPKQQMVSVGHPAEVSCNISSKGYLTHPAISWVHNGADIAPSGGTSKYYLPQPHVLRVNQASRSDSGVYQCFVRNPSTGIEVQASAEIIVQEEASRLTSVFSEQTVQPGRSVYLHCFATGNPWTGAAASISWSVDSLMMPYTSGRISVWSNKIDEHTVKSYLNISSVQVEDGGLYCCSIDEDQVPARHQRSTASSRQHCARLNVYGMAFIRWTTNKTAVSGEDYYLDCPFAGYPILSITWYRHGQLLQESDKYQHFSNGTLRIASIDPNADGGEYTCLVRGASSSTAKRALYVDIVRPPVIEPFTFPSLVQDGGRTQVTCSISAGDLPMQITWLKDGRPIGHQLNVETQTGEFHSLLIFKKLRGEHSGSYTCTARNLAAVASHSATLLVQVAPKWIVEPQDVAVLENSAAKIACQVHGMPPPSVVWYKIDGESQHMIHPASGKMSIQNDGTLLLSRVIKSDEGTFMCKANNNIGSPISKSVRVTVNAGARVRVQPSESTLPSGSEAWLRCEVSGDLPLTVHWKKGNQLIETNHRIQLTSRSMAGGQQRQQQPQLPQLPHQGQALDLNMSRVLFDDSGTYTCEAANSFGSDSAQVQLMIQELPRAPQDVQIINVMSRTVELQWREAESERKAGRPATASALEYLIELSRIGGGPKSSVVNQTVDKGRTFAVMPNLLPFTGYQLRVYAINYAGMGPPSDPLAFYTLEEAPSGQPRYVLAEAKSSRSVLVSWLAPAEETWNGRLVTYVVQCLEKSSSRHLIQRSVAAVSSDQLIDSLSNIRRQAILEPLKPATSYSISIRSLNRVGSGPESETVIVNTPEAAPSASPLNINCVALSADAIQVAWSPPSGEHHNGLLQGFRLFYKPMSSQQQSTSAFEFHSPESFRVDSKRVGNVGDSILHGLQAYQNYSIQVSAINRAGNGPLSAPIMCQTDENVAGTPQDLKVMSTSGSSILVSWRRPTPSNGRVTHYTVSVKDNATQDRKVFVVKESLAAPDGHVSHELRDLVENRYYQIYVTASTRVGESRPSRQLSVAPVSKSSAKIVEFSRNIYVEKHSNVILPCTTVGVSPVDKIWTSGGKPLAFHSSINYQWGKENALQLLDVDASFEGDYTCSVQNVYGRDSIVYSVSVLQVPDPPLLSVVSTSGTSISLSWTKSTNKLPIVELIVHYRPAVTDARSHTKSVDANEDGTVLEDLQCGTQYELQIQARNKIGTGAKSAVVRAMTRGSGPLTPDTDRLFSSVQSVPSSLIFHSDHWPSGGCRINYIQIEKRGPLLIGHNSDQPGPMWKVLAASLNPDEQPMYKIHDFMADDVHQLKLTAYSDAGTLTAFYDVQRLAQKNGSHFQVKMMMPPGGVSVSYEALIIIVCMSISSLMLLFSIGAIVYVMHKRRQYRAASRSQDKSEYSLRTITERIEDHQNDRPLLPDENSTYSLRKQLHNAPMDYDDDITPYATFTLKPICGPMDTNRSLMSVPSRGPDSHSSNSIEADLYGHHPTLPCAYQTHVNRHLNRSPVPPYRHSDTDRSDSTMYSDTYATKNMASRKRSQRMTQCEVLRPPSHFSDLHNMDNDFVKIRF